MTKIVLVCGAGMSTSLLVTKMEQVAAQHEGTYEIMAVPGSGLKGVAEEADVLLLGPQISFRKKEYAQTYEPHNVIVDVIDSLDYGMMNGEKVFNHALNLLKNK